MGGIMEISEKFIYHIWDAQHLNSNLKTVSEKNLKILFQGRWNTASGPDFKDAIILLDNEVFRGDIEIHLKSYDWIAHKHHEDKNFNNVALHVVYQNKTNEKFTIDESGKLIEILELSKCLDRDISKLIKKYGKSKFEVKDEFCGYFAALSSEVTEKLLLDNGIRRLERKIKRFSAELVMSDFDQLIYMGIFEALGYSKNKFQMLQLARKISFPMIKKYRENGMTKEQLISLFICSSNLIEHIPSTFPKAIIHKWIHLYSTQDFCSEKILIDWKLFRIRPVNHPVIRIIQIIDIIWEAASSSLFNQVVRIFSFSESKIEMKEFYRRLYDFFRSKNELLPERYLMGKTRIDTILFNIILPLIILFAEENGYEKLKKSSYNIYTSYHALPHNYIINHMQKFMQPSQKKVFKNKAALQQGVLNIYFEYCKDHNCKLCHEHRKNQLELM